MWMMWFRDLRVRGWMRSIVGPSIFSIWHGHGGPSMLSIQLGDYHTSVFSIQHGDRRPADFSP
jgi:hypothetical protein